jgi:flagellar biosynthesis/type III secretory pathway protein FliH
MSEEKVIEPDVKQEVDTQVENNVKDNIPRSRLNEVITQKKELESQISEMKAMIEERKRADLEEQGKLSELNSVLSKELLENNLKSKMLNLEMMLYQDCQRINEKNSPICQQMLL